MDKRTRFTQRWQDYTFYTGKREAALVGCGGMQLYLAYKEVDGVDVTR